MFYGTVYIHVAHTQGAPGAMKWLQTKVTLFALLAPCSQPFVKRKFRDTMPLSMDHYSIRVHIHTSNVAWVSTWVVCEFAVQNLDPQFTQDNPWIVPIRTLHINKYIRNT